MSLRRPASLRGRVVLGVLALLTVLLVALFAAVDLAMAARLRSDLRTRLEDRVALAEQLDGALQPQQLVDRLKGDGVQVQLCTPTTVGTSLRCVSPRVAPGPPAGAQPGRGQGQQPPPGAHAPNKPSAAPITQDGSTLFVHVTLAQSGQVLSLAVDNGQVGATVGGLIAFETVGGLLCLVVAALLLGRVVGTALRPLDEMTTLARRIAAGGRGRRLGTGRGNTELGRTAVAFDAMLDELETALQSAGAAQAQLRQFVGDASHELRSPLAGLQASTELLLRDEPRRGDREHAYVAMIRETRRANRLVDDLLTVARLDDLSAHLMLEPADLVDIAEHEVDRLRLRSPDLDVHIDAVEHAPVKAEALRLGQIVANLLDNARQASAPGGRIDVQVRTDDTACHVEVADAGAGVPGDDRERIFERLVRLDSSRSRATGGFGLGLPIARALARAHGGDVLCLPSHTGAVFRLTLPLRAADHRA